MVPAEGAVADAKVELSCAENSPRDEDVGRSATLSEEDMMVSCSSFAGKRSFQPYHSQSVPKPENLEANVSANKPVTTMMLRNIPNKYTQASLLQEIDELGFAGSYNFFYLPMDVHNRSNVGYAFVNFNLPKDAERFRRIFGDHRFQRFQSRKISSVCPAHVQGLDENLRHFENRAVTHARNDQYRPVVLKGAQRVDFEEAVAEALARAGSGGATNKGQATAATSPSAPAGGNQKSGGRPERKGSTSTNGSAAKGPSAKAPAAPTVPVAPTAPEPPRTARQGLEAAIRDLLSGAVRKGKGESAEAVAQPEAAGTEASEGPLPAGPVSLPSTSGEQFPASSFTEAPEPALVPPPGLVAPPGLASQAWGQQGAAAPGMTDMRALLSMRTALVDRLQRIDFESQRLMGRQFGTGFGGPEGGLGVGGGLGAQSSMPLSGDGLSAYPGGLEGQGPAYIKVPGLVQQGGGDHQADVPRSRNLTGVSTEDSMGGTRPGSRSASGSESADTTGVKPQMSFMDAARDAFSSTRRMPMF